MSEEKIIPVAETPVQMMRLKLSGTPASPDMPLHGSRLALTDMDTGRLVLFKDLRLVMDDARSFVWAQFTVPLYEVDLEGVRGIASTEGGIP